MPDIDDENLITTENKVVQIGEPVLTRYERARIVGARALQISHGAPILIPTDRDDFRPNDVASKELKARVLPIGLSRTLPNNKYQIIPIQWLKDREFITQMDVEEDKISRKPTKQVSKEQVDEDLTKIKGIGPATAEELKKAGYTSVFSVAEATIDELIEVNTISDTTAKRFKKRAQEILKE